MIIFFHQFVKSQLPYLNKNQSFLDTSNLIQYAGSKSVNPNEPLIQNIPQNGYILLSKFNPDETITIRTGSNDVLYTKFLKNTCPIIFFKKNQGTVEYKSKTAEQIVETLGTVDDESGSLFISNSNQKVFQYQPKLNDDKSDDIIISYTEPVDVKVEIKASQKKFNVILFVNTERFNYQSTNNSSNFSNVMSLFLHVTAFQSDPPNITITRISETTTEPTLNYNGFYDYDLFDNVNFSGPSPYQITTVNENRSSSQSLDVSSNQQYSFHFPFKFDPYHKFLYESYSNPKFENLVEEYQIQYTTEDDYPFYFFGDKYGKIHSQGDGKQILEKYGNLPDTDFYLISNYYNSSISYSNISQKMGSLTQLFSFAHPVNLTYSLQSRLDGKLSVYINGETIEIPSSITNFSLVNVTDLLLVVRYSNSETNSFPSFSINTTLSDPSTTDMDPAIVYKRICSKEELINSKFKSDVFSGKYNIPFSYSFSKSNGFHFIHSFSNPNQAKVIYNPGENIRTNLLFQNFPFYLNSYTSGQFDISSDGSSDTVYHTFGTFPDKALKIYVSNVYKESEIFHASDFSNSSVSLILIAYPGSANINISFEDIDPFKLFTSTSSLIMKSDTFSSIQNTEFVFIQVDSENNTQPNWTIRINRTTTPKTTTQYPLSQFLELDDLEKYDLISFIPENPNFISDEIEYTTKSEIINNFDEPGGFFMPHNFTIGQTFSIQHLDHNHKKIKSRTINFAKSKLPFYYFYCDYGTVKADIKKGFYSSISGYFQSNRVFISNTNNVSYVFNTSIGSYSDIIISYSMPVELTIKFFQDHKNPRYSNTQWDFVINDNAYRINHQSILHLDGVKYIFIPTGYLSEPLEITRSESELYPPTISFNDFLNETDLILKKEFYEYWWILLIIIPVCLLIIGLTLWILDHYCGIFGKIKSYFNGKCCCQRSTNQQLNNQLLNPGQNRRNGYDDDDLTDLQSPSGSSTIIQNVVGIDDGMTPYNQVT